MKSLSRTIAAYSLGAGAATLATSAQAEIHYSGPLNFTGDTVYFDLLNTISPTAEKQSADNFELASSKSGQKPAAYGLSGNAAAGSVSVTKLGKYRFVTPEFHSGDTIGSSPSFGTSGYLNNFSASTPPGQWQVGDIGFLGLEIAINGQTDYGWAEIQLNNGGSMMDPTAGQFTLFGYAYDDSGNPIIAGRTSSPVADSGDSIGLLLLGAAGVLALRSRRAKPEAI